MTSEPLYINQTIALKASIFPFLQSPISQRSLHSFDFTSTQAEKERVRRERPNILAVGHVGDIAQAEVLPSEQTLHLTSPTLLPQDCSRRNRELDPARLPLLTTHNRPRCGAHGSAGKQPKSGKMPPRKRFSTYGSSSTCCRNAKSISRTRWRSRIR